MAPNVVLAELEEAIKEGSSAKRVKILRRVTNLFLDGADRFTEQQISVFDDVLTYLIKMIEAKALVQLSTVLAPCAVAPIEVVRQLARNSEIAVAGPILSQSARLTDHDLIEIAKDKSQKHLLAISGRSSLTEAVTDVLVQRGDRDVAHRVTQNAGARFSEASFDRLVEKAAVDETLSGHLSLRLDIPPRALKQLLSRATDAVRAELFASVPPENQEQIRQLLGEIANEVKREITKPLDYSSAENVVSQLNRQGKLNESALLEFVRNDQYEEMIATLALFCGVSTATVEQLMKNTRQDGVILICKAAKLNLAAFIAILKNRFPYHSATEEELEIARNSFLTISQVAAQRAIRFVQVKKAAATDRMKLAPGEDFRERSDL